MSRSSFRRGKHRARTGASARWAALAAALPAALVLGLVAPAPSAAHDEPPTSAPGAGRAWEPAPLREETHQLGPKRCLKPFDRLDRGLCLEETEVYPDRQSTVEAEDGTKIYYDVWLPREKAAPHPVAPAVPAVAVVSPYATRTEETGFALGFLARKHRDLLVQRGYAYVQVHTRGTGSSGGCFDAYSGRDAEDVARIVEALSGAAWSNGRVALLGISYGATAALNAAARGERHRLRGLETVLVASPLTSPADLRTRDGVLITHLPQYLWNQSNARATSLLPGRSDVADAPAGHVPNGAERAPCRLDEGREWAADTHGGVSDWEVERDLRRVVQDIDVPTLFTMGLQEVQMRHIPGFFDQLGVSGVGGPKKVGLFGQWGHAYPGDSSRVPAWRRDDWQDMLVGWLDHFLLRVDNGVEDWPAVQLQDTEGQWRTERGFPLTGGPVGHLALGENGRLGPGTAADEEPRGSDVVTPQTVIGPRVQSQRVRDSSLLWETEPVTSPLRITGEPVLDVWVQLDAPAGQLVAELVAVDKKGTPLLLTRRVGARSLRYLDSIADGHFTQREPTAPPTGQPVRVQLRLDPTDLVVPTDGRLQLRLGAAGPAFNAEVWREDGYYAHTDYVMSGVDPGARNVTILHDCEHLSALRFLMPGPDADLIDVREPDQVGTPLGRAGSSGSADDGTGGVATQRVCDQEPERLESFGRPAPHQKPERAAPLGHRQR